MGSGDEQKSKAQLIAEIAELREKLSEPQEGPPTADREFIERLKLSEEKFATAFRSNANLLALSEVHNGRLLEVSDTFLRVLGYERDDVIGKTTLELRFFVDPDIRGAIIKTVREQGNVRDVEVAVRAKSGEIHHGLFSLDIIQLRGKALLLSEMKDITELKRVEEERRKLEEQIHTAQRLDSLGVLAGGIAHDFNNLLVAILGNADLALTDISPGSSAADRVGDIIASAKRAAKLAQQMLAYSGRGNFDVRTLDLNSIVEETVNLVRGAVSRKAALSQQHGQDIPPVRADALQLRQVLINLIINASESLGEDAGVVAVRTGIMECDRVYLSSTYLDDNLPEGVYSYIQVADTGCGMEEQVRGKMFDPFYTTKFTGRGLGLSAVLGIVRGHKGAIKVESNPGKGTTVTVLFPIPRTE
jgi:PAS domain S-box-containing protein